MEELHIPRLNDPGKYLELPSMWGQLKKAALGFLKSRIQDKFHGWRSKTLNHAVKEVLIKAVITPILTYAMIVFFFPKRGASNAIAVKNNIIRCGLPNISLKCPVCKDEEKR